MHNSKQWRHADGLCVSKSRWTFVHLAIQTTGTNASLQSVRGNFTGHYIMHYYLRLFISLTFLCFISCDTGDLSKEKNGSTDSDSATIHAGQEWLKKNIESFFNNNDDFLRGFSSLCTPQYAEFKSDAINIEFDGMTEAEFKSKWGRRYSQYAGIGEGFMIAGTDFGKIEVVKCKFRNMTEMKNFLYDVVIVDKTFNSKFTRQVV
jgi:hypothetical protein